MKIENDEQELLEAESCKLPSPRTLEELNALLRERIPDAIMGHTLSAKAVYYELRKLIGKDEMMITDCKYAPQIQGYPKLSAPVSAPATADK